MDNCLQKIKAHFSPKVLVFFTIFMIMCMSAQAVDYTWNGSAGDGLWDTAANWTPTGIPGTNDQVTLNGTENITLSGTVTVKFLYIFTGTDSSS